MQISSCAVCGVRFAEQFEADSLVIADRRHEPDAPALDRLEGDEIGEPLDRLGDVAGEEAEPVARHRAEPVDLCAQHPRRQRRVEDKRQDRQRNRPGDEKQGQQHGRRHQDRDQRRRHGMGKEILDRFDVLCGERDQVARTAAHQIGGGQRVELAEQVDPHLSQQSIRDIVRQP